MEQVQYISNEQNNITGVIVPIDLWRSIWSENQSDTKRVAMRARLVAEPIKVDKIILSSREELHER
jgi:hypothetical protein